MSGALGVFVRQQRIETGLGIHTPSSLDVSGMTPDAVAAYILSQHEAVQLARPMRPWYDPSQSAPAGFESVLWPPTEAALFQLLHDNASSVAIAATGRGLCPWTFRVPPCEVVRAMLGAEAVFEDQPDDPAEPARLVVIGLPFPAMDPAGGALLTTAVRSGGLVCLSPRLRLVGGMPPGHRRRSSEDSGEYKLWIGPKGAVRVKRPYASAWVSPQGIVWPNAETFWTVAWPAAVMAKIKDVKERWAPKATTCDLATPAERQALIDELQLPTPGPLDRWGKPIGAERTKERNAEWNKYLRRNKYDEKFVPKCPGKNWPKSANAVVAFCPVDEHNRCPRKPRATVADVLADGHRAPCMVTAIECGGNDARFQAAGIIAVAAAKRAACQSPTPLS